MCGKSSISWLEGKRDSKDIVVPVISKGMKIVVSGIVVLDSSPVVLYLILIQ
jgi:hypothetical protein